MSAASQNHDMSDPSLSHLRSRFGAVLDGPSQLTADPLMLLSGYLDWYRAALLRKIEGLTDEQLRTVLPPLTWTALGLVRHLGYVERRWLEWGFLARDVAPTVPGAEDAEWDAAATTGEVIAEYQAQVRVSREIVASARWDQPAQLGGRFVTSEQAAPLGRILAHLYQEYARHLGQLDVLRELLDGTTGE